jgi:hypothetical protein
MKKRLVFVSSTLDQPSARVHRVVRRMPTAVPDPAVPRRDPAGSALDVVLRRDAPGPVRRGRDGVGA